MANTQTNGFSLDHPGPLSGPNPFGFASLDEARHTLLVHFYQTGEDLFTELKGVAQTIDLLVTATSEASDVSSEMSAAGLCYLADKLTAVQRQLGWWFVRGEQLARIVEKQDLDVLATCPVYQREA